MLERAAPLDRLEELLRFCSKQSRILEIGPSHAPAAPRAAGWNTAILDHDTRAALIEKYGRVTDVGAIEEVDFIWRGGRLHSAIPEAQWGSFDVLIASHVIEHFPDFIAFFAAAACILKPRGVISLAVPDKRFCFDCFRPVTSTGEVLAARGRSRHGDKAIFDGIAYFALDQAGVAWDRQSIGTPRPMWPIVHAGAELERLRRSDASDYLDFHGGVFTPASFELLILELGALGELDWHVASNSGTCGNEFIVHLRRGVPPLAPAALASARQRWLLGMLFDHYEQACDILERDPDSGALLQSAAQTGRLTQDAGGDGDALVGGWAQKFVLQVHAGDYAGARNLAPLFQDLELTCAALARRHSDRLHTLYCLGVLALAQNDHDAARQAFARLLREARQCRRIADLAALGDEFIALATPQCEVLGYLKHEH